MSRRLIRISLALVLLLSSQVWALGLGDIKLDSALNEPLRAEIDLLSATPEEIDDLKVQMASADTFDRYGIDRPHFLQGITFDIVKSGAITGNRVVMRSTSPITEPFLTFLVEASWSQGRVLREYTVLLDPPTYAPPAVQQAPVVQAPRTSTSSDSGRIERQPAPQPAPRPAPAAKPAPVADNTPYDTRAGGDLIVQRGDTLWGIASRVQPDSRLSTNQTMLAIYEANPDAFGGNINLLRAGASLRIPSADEIYRISRGEALNEVRRQNSAWGSSPAPTTSESRPGLVLVPPDEEDIGTAVEPVDEQPAEPLSREDEITARIDEIENSPVPELSSLIDIRNNELASLREELARIRGEVYEPPVSEEPAVEDEALIDDGTPGDDDLDDVFVDTGEEAAVAEDPVVDEAATEDEVVEPAPTVVRQPEESLVDKILGAVTGIWGIIAGAVLLVAGVLFWFLRRDSGEADDSGPWQSLDADDAGQESMAATASIAAPARDEDAFVVVEQDSAIRPIDDDTVESPLPTIEDTGSATGEFGSLEDTFSSETAVNLDQQDPLAEADFHMAYGLYDQAADLINGALDASPGDQDLLAKLCEIYFVWGNRDSFVDAAGRLKSAIGDASSPDWDKTVIMGQQIAPDDSLFAGASAAGVAADSVDLSFDAESDGGAALDMDFGGGDAGSDGAAADDGLDFIFDGAGDNDAGDGGLDMDLEATAESPTMESALDPEATGEITRTVEMPAAESTIESPTIEQPAPGTDGTAELPSLAESLGNDLDINEVAGDATAEINLDDLGLDIDDLDMTGELPAIDEMSEVTGNNPALEETAETEVGIEASLLDATGRTQVLSEDMAVDTASDIGTTLSDDDATMLARMDDDEAFEFAQTEALPADAFSGGDLADETGELPAVGNTDVDLDLDDLTEALKLSQGGDTVDMPRDDATVEQPRLQVSDSSEFASTLELGPDDMSEELDEARTMTEVGTKLDLARAYVDMGDPGGARSILEEVLDEGDESQRQQAQQLLDTLPS